MKIFLNNRPVSICRSVILLVFFCSQLTYSQSITLPFFDDFSQNKTSIPNPKLWKNGGVSINNSFPINQPSVNVATFDSRNSAGIPYNFSDKFAYGSTDTLTSVAIDLSGLAKDSVYLSFYWQAKGLGELPDSDDSLVVSMLDSANKWKMVWFKTGTSEKRDSIFNQALISIPSTSFFHKNFQFRFETRGRQSGAFDMWHIDFVYLNTKRRIIDYYTQDVSLKGFENNYLKRYTAMPLNQYLVNPKAEVNDRIVVGVQNLQYSKKPEGSGGARNVNFVWQVSDTVSKTTYVNIINPTQSVRPFINRNLKTESKSNTIEPITDFTRKEAVLKFTQKFVYQNVGGSITRPDSTNNIPEELLLSNDSVSIYTPLLDYYAYDDGTAETGADTDQTLGKVAVKFTLNKPDTVNAVRFNFTPFFKDISGQFFLLQITESANGKPAKILHQQSVRVRYASDINGFIEYPLDMNIAVKDTFFVAWTKVNEDVIGIGVDKNTPQFADKIYYSIGNEWIQNKSLKGSLMVRPMMGFKANGTGQNGTPLASEEPTDKQFLVYPNPTSGVLRWNFENIQSISIFDVSGREIFYKKTDSQELNIENLPDNIYYINFSDGKKNFIRKIMVVH
ncbi:MAG: T9SS type A sorting domain-containing protein [Emticicia sp.]|nr:T9SS type A sorting domain-containing protein [Emticicia sp.]